MGFYIMKDMKNFIGKVTAKIAYDTAEKNANSICTWVFYQPKLPEKVKKLRRFPHGFEQNTSAL